MSDDLEEVPGETARERGVRKTLLGKKSDFGEGVLVPLLYWSRHFMSDQYDRIFHVGWWIQQGMPPVPSLHGSYDRRMVEDIESFAAAELKIKAGTWRKPTKKKAQAALSWAIEMFFYGAADHLYGLRAPEAFPEELKTKIEQLRDQGLTYRMYRLNKPKGLLTPDHVTEIWELTKQIALEIDQRMLGVEDADLGEND